MLQLLLTFILLPLLLLDFHIFAVVAQFRISAFVGRHLFVTVDGLAHSW